MHATPTVPATPWLLAPELRPCSWPDLGSIDETKTLAAEANKLGPYDAVIHIAGVFLGMERVLGKSGLPTLFTVNTLAPYLLTMFDGTAQEARVRLLEHAHGWPPQYEHEAGTASRVCI